mgnify:CR=1 FL=1
MSQKLNGSALRRYLRPSVRPAGVSDKDFHAAITEMARLARQRVIMAECGPCPCPFLPDSGLRAFFRWLFHRRG